MDYRVIENAEIYEVSVVANPANPDCTIEVIHD